MLDIKRKTRDEHRRNEKSKNNKKGLKHKKSSDKRKRRGPELPSSLRKELNRLKPTSSSPFNSDIDEDEVYGKDVYEYEEGIPEEESKKNRRFDPVENLDYELPDEFDDENVSSDDDNGDVGGSEEDKEDGGIRHARMLQGITGMPIEAFEGKKKNSGVVISEAYPESEYNPSRDVVHGDGCLSIEDLLEPLQGKSNFSKLKKRVRQLEKSQPTLAPLPKADRERLERKAAYEQSKLELHKWVPIVKRNREAPTVYFDTDTDVGFSTVGAIASEFEPRTEFEKKIASIINDEKVMDAHKKDGSRLLELNKISVEDEKDRQSRIAKMRSLLFRHEMKAKHIKKIKSKTYHRLLKKDRLKEASAQNEMDPAAAKELARKHEFERAKERMTLRHKSSSKWTRRIKERGFDVQDEGTRVAIAEQQATHAQLTRKINSMKDDSSSSSEDSSDEENLEENPDQDRPSRLLEAAKDKAFKVINEEDEVPISGLLSLPFMVRGIKKRDEIAAEEAKLAIEELECLSNKLGGSSGAENQKNRPSSGRMVFGAAAKQAPKLNNKPKSDDNIKSNNFYDNSDSEDDLMTQENDNPVNSKNNHVQRDVDIDTVSLNEDSNLPLVSLLKSSDNIVQELDPKTTNEVAIFVSGGWKKKKSVDNADTKDKMSTSTLEPVSHNQASLETMKELDEDNASDSEGGQMVDGILSSGPKPSYELPSQADLIREAFAADDVEDDFEKIKQEILNEENPEPEKPALLPGWGQWTDVQQKKGLPSWMLKEHDNSKRKREEALRKRKDANLKNVIISEKLDKKAEKLYTKALPFPFTSNEVFEQSIRMPIGPDFNPASAVGPLNRPEVMKRPGIIIKPIKGGEVDPYEEDEEEEEERKKSGKKQKMKDHKQSGTKQKKKKNKDKRKSPVTRM